MFYARKNYYGVNLSSEDSNWVGVCFDTKAERNAWVEEVNALSNAKWGRDEAQVTTRRLAIKAGVFRE